MIDKIKTALKERMPVVFSVVATILILTALTEVLSNTIEILKNHKAILGVVIGSQLFVKVKEFINAKIK